MENKSICIDLDGWSNTHNEPIICLTATLEDGTNYLIKTIDTIGIPHTADNLIKIAEDSIEHTEETFKCNVISFVTDNAANMKSMRDKLSRSNIITYGCAAHFANLLANDIENTITKELQII